MSESIEELKKELEHYKKKFSISEYDLALDGYLAYVGLVKQQVDFIKDFSVKSNIDGKKAETVLYDRATAMGESLPDMITKLNKLKSELNIEYDSKEGQPKLKSSNPQNIGK